MLELLKAFIALFNATCYITEQGLKVYASIFWIALIFSEC
jgi:hypothetical protein